MYKYSEIDIKIFMTDIRINSVYMLKKCLENNNYDNFCILILDIAKNISFINICKNRYNLSLEKIINQYYLKDDIFLCMKKCYDKNITEITENLFILEELYKIDRKFFIDNIELDDCEKIFKHLYTAGEGIQKNLSAREWESRNITKYYPDNFIVI